MRKLMVLLVLCAGIKASLATPMNVFEGKLSEVNQLQALAAIAGGSSGETFLELLNGTWHPMSFWRFMLLGPPPNKEAFNLTAENELLEKQLSLSGTLNSSLALYQKTEPVKEVGKVNITAWSCAYACYPNADENNTCYALVPVVILEREYLARKPQYANVFRGLATGSRYLVSSISADIINLTYSEDQRGDFTTRMPQGLTECNRSMWAATSGISASYGLPGVTCYNVRGSLRSIKRHSQTVLSNYNLSSFLNWTSVPIKECSSSPSLFQDSSSNSHWYACIDLDGSFDCIAPDFTGSSGPDFTVSSGADRRIVKQKYSSKNISIIDSAYKYLLHPPKARIQGSGNGRSVKSVWGIVEGVTGSLPTSSKWELSYGEDKDEFLQGQAEGQLCYMKASSFTLSVSEPISCTEATSSRCNPTGFSADLLQTTMKDTADSFVAGHIQKFNLKNGPYVSSVAAASLAIATVLGVLMAVEPVTLWELRRWDKGWPFKPQDRPKSTTKATRKSIFLAIVNLVIGAGIFSPIFVAMADEYNKREPFNTWAILARAQKANSYGTPYVFLTFVEGSSMYTNVLVWCWYIPACAIALLAVPYLTFHYSYPRFKGSHGIDKDGKKFGSNTLSSPNSRSLNSRAMLNLG